MHARAATDIGGAQPLDTTTAAPRVALDGADSLTNGQLAAVTLGRLALIVGYRIVYPLQPFLALHLHVDLRTVSALVTVQVLASIASPLGGTLADTRGERATMAGGLALFCLGAALCAISTSFGGFLAGYVLIGLSTAIYQPAAQAYLSARTSYRRRGWALGVFETSWAGGALLGVAPLMQLVQATDDSVWAFWILLVAGVGSLALVRFGLPPTQRHAGHVRTRLDWGALRTASVLGVLALLFLSSIGVDQLFVIQGAWAKDSFGASEGQLGLLFALMGIAELGGSLGSTVLVDRVGKKRAVLGGYALTGLAMLALPLSSSWPLFVALFFVFDLFFEFSVVSAFPLASGVAPAVRGTVMALAVLMNGLGRAIGSQVAEPLWSSTNIWVTGVTSAALTFAGVLLCLALVREHEGAQHS